MSGSKRLGTSKEVEKVARLARRQGITVEVVNSHLTWEAPNGDRYRSALTAGDPRRIKAIYKWLREHNVTIPK